MQTDTFYMERALALAREAAADGEVPVGCVVVRRSDGAIVGQGRNRRERNKNALAHAEIEALDAACRALNGWRLWDCELFVTLEPCPMCAGAIVNARIARVVFGAPDAKMGACGSVTNLFAENWNHKPSLTTGVLTDACGNELRDFFRKLRSGEIESPGKTFFAREVDKKSGGSYNT